MPVNEGSIFVEDFLIRKALNKLGYVFDGDNLTAFEVDCLMTIEAQFNKLQELEMKKKKPGKGYGKRRN